MEERSAGSRDAVKECRKGEMIARRTPSVKDKERIVRARRRIDGRRSRDYDSQGSLTNSRRRSLPAVVVRSPGHTMLKTVAAVALTAAGALSAQPAPTRGQQAQTPR